MSQIIGSAIAQFVVRSNAGQFVQVGEPVQNPGAASGETTLTVGIANEGDLLVVPISYESTTLTVTGVTAEEGKLTNFALLAPRVTDTSLASGLELWAATATDGNGVDTIQVAFSASNAGIFTSISAIEFTANNGPSGNYYLQNAASADVAVATTTPVWSNLGVPADAPALEFGYMYGQGVMSAGATPGCTYFSSYDTNYQGVFFYDPAVSAGLTPAAVQAPSGRYLRASAQMGSFQAPNVYDTTAEIHIPPVPSGIQWVIYQLSVEIRLASGAVPANASAYLNTRSMYTLDVPGTIQGPPYYTIRPGDDLVVVVTGAPNGAQCIATFLYHEYPNGHTINLSGVV